MSRNSQLALRRADGIAGKWMVKACAPCNAAAQADRAGLQPGRGPASLSAAVQWILAWLFPLLLLALMLGAPAVQAQQVDVPKLTQRVTDLTGTLDSATQARLTQQLESLEQRKGAQIAVLMLPTTGEDTIESFARRVFDQWRLGRKQVDDGILLLVAKDDRRLRIEVGYGLEGAVPDLLAGRIIREQITPQFKVNDYSAGVVAGVQSLVSLVDGEELPAPPISSAGSGSYADDEPPYVMFPAVAFMTYVMPAGMAMLVGGVFTYLLTESLLLGIVGVFAGLLFSIMGRRFRRNKESQLARASRRGGIAGGIGGGFAGGRGGRGGGGFGGGFSGGGGGFGGGGGGSGGGGASGSW